MQCDIVSVCETHLADQNNIHIDGYKWFGFNRPDIHRKAPKPSGGVGIFVKRNMSEQYNVSVIDKSYDGILGLKFEHMDNDSNFIVYACYLPPENSTRGRDAQSFYSHLLAQIYINNDCDSIYVAADFNSRIGSISDIMTDIDEISNRISVDKTVNQHGHEFIDFLNEAKFCVLNGRFNDSEYTSISRKGRAVVDYICVPHEDFKKCKSFNVITVQSLVDKYDLHGLLGERSKLPDHSALTTDITVTNYIYESDSHAGDQEIKSTRFKLKTIPDNFMDSDLARSAIIDIISQIERCRDCQEDIDSIYTNLCKSIVSEMNRKLPKHEVNSGSAKRYRKKKPYWNDSLTDLWNYMRIKENTFLKCTDNKRVKMVLQKEYVLARNHFDKLLRQTERAYRRLQAVEIETMSTNNPTEFWNKIGKLGPKSDRTIPREFIDSEGNTVCNERDVLEKWRHDFKNLYNGGDNNEFDTVHYNRTKMHKILLENRMNDPLYLDNENLNYNITIEEVTTVIMKAKSRSACGYDEIPYTVLKNPPIIAILQQLFQLVFDTGIIPCIWRKAIICPILKDPTSDKRIPMNYRGVSLLSCISKLYSAFIDRRLTRYLEDNDLLADEQNGFRKNRSCEDHVFVLNSIIRNNPTVFTAFIDLRKCFDFIDRDMMLYKLILNGIDGKMYNTIKSIYQHTLSCVKVNSKYTDWFDCKTGVKQGDNVSPTLFSIFINDLVKEINDLGLGYDIDGRKVSMLLYADDIVIFARTEHDLQKTLDVLHEWCKRWRVLINTDKSKCIHFRKGRTSQTEHLFKIGNNILETVDTYKYLGVTFGFKGDFTTNSVILAKGAGRALGKIISKIHFLKDIGLKTFEKLYESGVVPILDYCSGVWGYRKYQAVDNIQHRAIRYYLGVHRFAPLTAINGDIGWIPSIYRRWTNLIRYWNRLIKFEDNRITKHTFNQDYILCCNNWSSDLKDVLNKLNLISFYNTKTTINLKTVKEKIDSYYSNIWANSLQTIPKLRTYIKIKSEFKNEHYTLLNLKKYERSLLAQFRCGILPLRIETGRYIGESREQRLCKMCQSNSVEDETHFLIKCDFYIDIRNDIFLEQLNDSTFNVLSDQEKLSLLINAHPRKCAKFIVKSYLRRRSSMYGR